MAVQKFSTRLPQAGLAFPLKFPHKYDIMNVPHKSISSVPIGNVFLFGKNAFSALRSLLEGKGFVWQQMELCIFRCVVPFGTTHFFIFQKGDSYVQ